MQQGKTGMRLLGVRKSFGNVEVIKGVDLEVGEGEFVVFVGPSGCGKSTLLRMIAGLEEVTDGAIEIGGREVTDLDPSKRGIAMVFQSYALYPHMTVRQNLGFGLEMSKKSKAEIAREVQNAARTLQIEPLLDRRPSQLSGGQRQRVAIGRAIVRSPQVFLFDEPLSNLDAELRVTMRIEIARLHKALGNTMVYVTHDQVEAMTLADKMVVLRNGVVEQVGPPRELYEDPANAFVGGFIGSPRMNLLHGEWVGDGRVRYLSSEFQTLAQGKELEPGTPVQIGIRAEHVSLRSDVPGIPATVEFTEYLGGTAYAYCRTASGQNVTIEQRDTSHMLPGDSIMFGCGPDKVCLFNMVGQRVR